MATTTTTAPNLPASPNGARNPSPEEVIRRYLDQHGGETDATVGNLLTSFDVDEGDGYGRDRIRSALSDAGVGINRKLPFLARDAAVHLFVAQAGGTYTAPAPAPPHRPPAMQAPVMRPPVTPPPVETAEPPRRRPRFSVFTAIAILGVLLLAAAIGAVTLGGIGGSSGDGATHKVKPLPKPNVALFQQSIEEQMANKLETEDILATVTSRCALTGRDTARCNATATESISGAAVQSAFAVSFNPRNPKQFDWAGEDAPEPDWHNSAPVSGSIL